MSVASTSRSDVLVERDRLVEQIEDVVARAAGGEARMLLIEGQAGIGKSRLAAEARRRAADAGMNVLTARGSELEREFPYGVVRQLFEGALVDPAARERLLAGAAAAAAPLFGPEPEDAGEARDASFTTLHGLYWLALNLAAEGPLAIQVDDLHWCDRPSLRFIAFLLNRLEGHPVIVVGSMRPEEPGADLALLADLERDPLTLAMSPTPLSAAGAAQLIEARLGRAADRTFADACHVATGGNPLLLTELLRAVESEGIAPEARNAGAVEDLGPRAVRRAVLVRLARLPAEAVAVAEAVAMLGEGPEVRHIAQLVGPRRGRRRPRARRARPRRDPAPRAPDRLRPPPGAGGDLPGHPARRAGAAPHPGGRASSASRARRATPSPPTCWRCRRWARTGWPTSSSTPPARRW